MKISLQTHLSIASFNVKGFCSNEIFVNDLLCKYDIILLQEHWLFNYEKEILRQHHPDFAAFTR